MRIALFSHNGQLEGAPLHLTTLAAGLQERGHICDVLSPEEGALFARCNRKNIGYHILPGLLNPAEHEHALHRLLTRLRPDVLLVNTIIGYHLISWLRHYYPHVPLIWMIHESESVEHIANLPAFDPVLFALPDHVIFMCDATRAMYAAYKGHFRTIQYGIDLDAIDAFRRTHDAKEMKRKHQLPLDRPTVSCIGTISPRKGQFELLRAAIRVLDTGTSAFFLFVGKTWDNEEPHRQSLLDRAEQEGRADAIRVSPETDRIFELLLATDILVLPSFVECSPLITLEAMAFCKPIIASATYGIKEQITPNVDGLLVTPGYLPKLTQSLLKLLRAPSLGELLASRGRMNVEQRFTQARMCDEYDALLQVTCKNKKLRAITSLQASAPQTDAAA